VFFAIYFSEERYATYIAGSEWTFVWAGSIITVQSLTWLTTKWNVNFDALLTTLSAKDVSSAQLIKVMPVTNAGSAGICPLIKDVVSKLCRKFPMTITH
jgi:manganese-transporting P-type ATPase